MLTILCGNGNRSRPDGVFALACVTFVYPCTPRLPRQGRNASRKLRLIDGWVEIGAGQKGW